MDDIQDDGPGMSVNVYYDGKPLEEADIGEILATRLDGEEEKLFKVAFSDHDDTLSADELAISARPMQVRGQQDDLSMLVEEEIVMEAVAGPDDIFNSKSSPTPVAAVAKEPEPSGVSVPHQRAFLRSGEPSIEVAPGDDVLGIPEDDDIGARSVVVRRKKSMELVARHDERKAARPETVEPIASSEATGAQHTDSLSDTSSETPLELEESNPVVDEYATLTLDEPLSNNETSSDPVDSEDPLTLELEEPIELAGADTGNQSVDMVLDVPDSVDSTPDIDFEPEADLDEPLALEDSESNAAHEQNELRSDLIEPQTDDAGKTVGPKETSLAAEVEESITAEDDAEMILDPDDSVPESVDDIEVTLSVEPEEGAESLAPDESPIEVGAQEVYEYDLNENDMPVIVDEQGEQLTDGSSEESIEDLIALADEVLALNADPVDSDDAEMASETTYSDDLSTANIEVEVETTLPDDEILPEAPDNLAEVDEGFEIAVDIEPDEVAATAMPDSVDEGLLVNLDGALTETPALEAGSDESVEAENTVIDLDEAFTGALVVEGDLDDLAAIEEMMAIDEPEIPSPEVKTDDTDSLEQSIEDAFTVPDSESEALSPLDALADYDDAFSVEDDGLVVPVDASPHPVEFHEDFGDVGLAEKSSQAQMSVVLTAADRILSAGGDPDLWDINVSTETSLEGGVRVSAFFPDGWLTEEALAVDDLHVSINRIGTDVFITDFWDKRLGDVGPLTTPEVVVEETSDLGLESVTDDSEVAAPDPVIEAPMDQVEEEIADQHETEEASANELVFAEVDPTAEVVEAAAIDWGDDDDATSTTITTPFVALPEDVEEQYLGGVEDETADEEPEETFRSDVPDSLEGDDAPAMTQEAPESAGSTSEDLDQLVDIDSDTDFIVTDTNEPSLSDGVAASEDDVWAENIDEDLDAFLESDSALLATTDASLDEDFGISSPEQEIEQGVDLLSEIAEETFASEADDYEEPVSVVVAALEDEHDDQTPNSAVAGDDLDDADTPSSIVVPDWLSHLDFDLEIEPEEPVKDMIADFAAESEVGLEPVEQALLDWEAGDADGSVALGRVLHTIKGSARAIGLPCLGAMAHNFETFLDGAASDDPRYFPEIQQWFDALLVGLTDIASLQADVSMPVPRGWVAKTDASAPQEEAEPSSEVTTTNKDAELAIPSADESVTQADVSGEWYRPSGIDFSLVSQSSGEVFHDFIDAFVEEAGVEIEKIEDAVSAWESDHSNDEAPAALARVLHNLKGIANGVGLTRYGTLVHNYETLMGAQERLMAEDASLFFRMMNVWLDAVVRGFGHVSDTRSDIGSEFPEVEGAAAPKPADSPPTPAPSAAAQSQPPKAAKATKKAKPDAKQSDKALADAGAKSLSAQNSVRLSSEQLDSLLNMASQVQQFNVRGAQSVGTIRVAAADMASRLRDLRAYVGRMADEAMRNVSAARDKYAETDLDALEMDQYTALQEAANILKEGVEDMDDLIHAVSSHTTAADDSILKQGFVLNSLTASIRSTRMVPISRLMPGLRRIVRTTAHDLGKQVHFRVLNEAGSLDRDHYDRCRTVLEHMIRNGLDHGIEVPGIREAAGKSPTGLITIDVQKVGGDYHFTLTDDGKGIDSEIMREKAIEKGLVTPEDNLSDEELQNLIFHKGFSTASKLTQVSGRGVGMDIVMDEVKRMGGEISIRSAVGKGTEFHFIIPAAISFNGAIRVEAGEHSYAIPLEGLRYVEQVNVDEFYQAIDAGDKLRIGHDLCEPAYLGQICHGLPLPPRSNWPHAITVLIAGDERRMMAIAIDEIAEALELVVRSLGAQFAAVPGVAGAATAADGKAIVALDLNSMVRSLGDMSTTISTVSQDDTPLTVLVVDDSRTQRTVASKRLRDVGIEPVTAENGLVAIETLNGMQTLPDAILLDIEMPVMDGIECLKEIRDTRHLRGIPVIMVTSRTGEKHRKLAEAAGCNAYMGKPFNHVELYKELEALTGREIEIA